jgi:hypothetical protein
MPGHDHESIVDLLAASLNEFMEVVSRTKGLSLPRGCHFEREDSNLSESAPVGYRADLVALDRDAAGNVLFAAILEVQMAPDEDKLWTWPAYWGQTRGRHRCPTALIVVTLDDATATWARKVGAAAEPHGWRPIVMAKKDIPRLTDPARIRFAPEVGLLSAMVHAEDEEVLQAVGAGVVASDLDWGLAQYFFDVIMRRGGELATHILEAAMQENYVFKSEWALRMKAEGREEGRAEARLEAGRLMLLKFISRRGLVLNPEQQARITSCCDIGTLDRWTERVFDGATVEEIFREDA